MSTQTLSVSLRTALKKKGTKALRNQGLTPGNVIGSGTDSIPLQFDSRDLERIFRQNESGKNTLIELKFDDSKQKSEKVITYNIDLDPASHQIKHVEFLTVTDRDSVRVSCPVKTVSKSKGEVMGGLLIQSLRRVQIASDPNQIPTEIVVDVKDLELGDSYKVKDLTFPEGVTSLNDPHNIVVTVMKQRGGAVEADLDAEGDAAAGANEAEPAS